MYYVGIDIAKRSHVACIMRDDNSLEVAPFEFDGYKKGFEYLVDALNSIGTQQTDIQIAMEATGPFFENLYRFLQELNYRVILLNPFQTAKFREMDTMKRVKNDNIDAKMIAALIKSGRFSEGYVSQEQLQSLRELSRQKSSLHNQLKALKRQTQTILAVVFPELEQVINDPFNISGLALLEKYPTAKHFEYSSVERILKTFRGIKGNNFNHDKASKLLALAKESVYSGVAKDARALNIQSNIILIRTLQTQMIVLEEAMLKLFDQTPLTQEDKSSISGLIDNLRTIPGVADKTILTVLAECGNLDRFTHAKALVGFIGLYPTLEQSGATAKQGHLAKRGAKLAKKALYLAAIASVRHNDELRTIYMNYRSKGRAKKECLVIVARKIATIMYAIYTKNIPYSPQRVFVAQS